jgi:hypothetical protein
LASVQTLWVVVMAVGRLSLPWLRAACCMLHVRACVLYAASSLLTSVYLTSTSTSHIPG